MPGTSKVNGSSAASTGATMWPNDVGIHAIEMYFPKEYVDQTDLEEYDGVSKGKYTIGLGQARMGFCSDREDITSLCLTVTKRLLEKTGVSPLDVGFLMVGTETIIDKSKSVKSNLMQLFEESGNCSIEGLDTTNACYGGTSALFHALSWIESSYWDGRYAIVVAGDIAVYSKGAARPTGGAGACAMLVGPNAPLVFDRGVRATHMAHTWDFYKPDLSSEYPVVDGKSSIICYTQALDKCYEIFCSKFEKNIQKQDSLVTLKDFDGLIFHSPYCKLVQKSVGRLLFNEFKRDPEPDFQGQYNGLEKFKKLNLENTYFDRDVEKKFVELSADLYEEKTKPSLLLATEIGNMYTASLYSCLVSYLLSKPLNKIAGQRVLLFSYGSGMAASLFSLRFATDLQPNSPLNKLHQSVRDIPSKLESRVKILPQDYEKILKIREDTHHLAPYEPQGNINSLYAGTYYLKSIDEIYRRVYERVPFDSTDNNTQTCLKLGNAYTNGKSCVDS